MYIRLMFYNWQQDDWPQFTYSPSGLEEDLILFVEQMGRHGGLLKGLSTEAKTEAVTDALISEAIKTSEIEGEFLSRHDVRSSIFNQLGLNFPAEVVKDVRAEGVAELLVHIDKTIDSRLSQRELFSWHRMLMKGNQLVDVGKWRKGGDPMQIVSGRIDKPKVHFEAPLLKDVPAEMKGFVKWFNAGSKSVLKDAPVRAALTHLYFESIHPFEDGNGRIGRALSDKVLSQSMGQPTLLSLSRAIESDKKSYYTALEKAQRSNEVTNWIRYFLKLILHAQKQSEELVDFILAKTTFLDLHANELNQRQRHVVDRMLRAGPEGFEGGMNARKYKSLTKASKATATRDLQKLVDLDVFTPEGGGRSVRYSLNI